MKTSKELDDVRTVSGIRKGGNLMVYYNGEVYNNGSKYTDLKNGDIRHEFEKKSFIPEFTGKEEDLKSFITGAAGSDSIIAGHIKGMKEITPIIDYEAKGAIEIFMTRKASYLHKPLAESEIPIREDLMPDEVNEWIQMTESSLYDFLIKGITQDSLKKDTEYKISCVEDITDMIEELAGSKDFAGFGGKEKLGSMMAENYYDGLPVNLSDDIRKTFNGFIIALYKEELDSYKRAVERITVEYGRQMPTLAQCISEVREKDGKHTQIIPSQLKSVIKKIIFDETGRREINDADNFYRAAADITGILSAGEEKLKQMISVTGGVIKDEKKKEKILNAAADISRLFDDYGHYMDQPVSAAVMHMIETEQKMVNDRYKSRIIKDGNSWGLVREDGKVFDSQYTFPQFEEHEAGITKLSEADLDRCITSAYKAAGLSGLDITRKVLGRYGYESALKVDSYFIRLNRHTSGAEHNFTDRLGMLSVKEQEKIIDNLENMDEKTFISLKKMRSGSRGDDINIEMALEDIYDLPLDKETGRPMITKGMENAVFDFRTVSSWCRYNIPAVRMYKKYPQLVNFLGTAGSSINDIKKEDGSYDEIKDYFLNGEWAEHNINRQEAMTSLNEMIITQMHERRHGEPEFREIIKAGIKAFSDTVTQKDWKMVAERMMPSEETVKAAEDYVRARKDENEEEIKETWEKLGTAVKKQISDIQHGKKLHPYVSRTTRSLADKFMKKYHFVPRMLPTLVMCEKYDRDSSYMHQAVPPVNEKYMMSQNDIVQKFPRRKMALCADFADPAVIMLNYAYDTGRMTNQIKNAIYRNITTQNMDRLIYLADILSEKKKWKTEMLDGICRNIDMYDRKTLKKVARMSQYQYDSLLQPYDEDRDNLEEIYGYSFEDNRVDIKGKDILISDKRRHLRSYILEADDPRNFTVGYDTDCCQHFDGAGETCVVSATQNPEAGIWIIENRDNGKIEAQAWIYADERTDTLVFDNIEFANDQQADDYRDILMAFVKESPYRNIHMGMGCNAVTGIGEDIDTDRDVFVHTPEIYDNGEKIEAYSDYHDKNRSDGNEKEVKARVLKRNGEILGKEYGRADSDITAGKKTGHEYIDPGVEYLDSRAYEKKELDRYRNIIKISRDLADSDPAGRWKCIRGYGDNRFNALFEYNGDHGGEEIVFDITSELHPSGENTINVSADLPVYLRQETGISSVVYNPAYGKVKVFMEWEENSVSAQNIDWQKDGCSINSINDSRQKELVTYIKHSLDMMMQGKEPEHLFPPDKDMIPEEEISADAGFEITDPETGERETVWPGMSSSSDICKTSYTDSGQDKPDRENKFYRSEDEIPLL